MAAEVGLMLEPLALQIASACCGLFSGVFFCIGALHIKQSTLEWLAVTFWEKGPILATQLAEQKIDFAFGAGWLALSFILLLMATVTAPYVSVPPGTQSLLAGTIVPAVLLVICYPLWRFLRHRATARIAVVVKEKG